MEFIFSSDGNDRITTKNKNVLINIEEIQEVVPRRFCFLWLGYEIFLKNKKSYLFNFFRPERSNEFFEYLSNISNKRKLNLLLIKDSKAYFKKKKYKNMFKNGEIDILISTTVIEVGVNVHNASMIVIFNANMFGLSTLHQLS